jgi:hypothetical protein
MSSPCIPGSRLPLHPGCLLLAGACALLLAAAPAAAQSGSSGPWGRMSFYADIARVSPDGTSSVNSGEFITTATFETPDADGEGLEYGIDIRQATYTTLGQPSRLSIYNGYVGARILGGRARMRMGQLWITDLGGLGSIAGGLVEYRQGPLTSSGGRWRAGGFFGVEPEPYAVGYVQGIRKAGGYVAFDGHGGRRHVIGYVRLDHSGLTERSVVSVTNFVPAASSHVFVYQMAEYDLVGPAGQGHGGLTYLFVNARVVATSRVELQGLYHRGRSIDARGITEDMLNGRPIPAGALDGLLYQSAGGRVTVQVARYVRVNAGYTRDRNNRESASTGRLTFGLFSSNLAHTGIDVTVTDSRTSRPDARDNALYLSVGRQVGRSVYLSADYSSSVSIASFTRSDGIVVETRPHTRQLSASSVVTLGRHVSLFLSGERTRDDTSSELRALTGFTYRFR